jgi:hypothetical protein
MSTFQDFVEKLRARRWAIKLLRSTNPEILADNLNDIIQHLSLDARVETLRRVIAASLPGMSLHRNPVRKKAKLVEEKADPIPAIGPADDK